MIKVSDEVHKELKVRAAEAAVTMGQFIAEMLKDK